VEADGRLDSVAVDALGADSLIRASPTPQLSARGPPHLGGQVSASAGDGASRMAGHSLDRGPHNPLTGRPLPSSAGVAGAGSREPSRTPL
jgi:hypothetical protein